MCGVEIEKGGGGELGRFYSSSGRACVRDSRKTRSSAKKLFILFTILVQLEEIKRERGKTEKEITF